MKFVVPDDLDLFVLPAGPLFNRQIDGRTHRVFCFCAKIVQERGRLPTNHEIAQTLGGSEVAADWAMSRLREAGHLLTLEPLKTQPDRRTAR